jgi:hypothetical protein
MVIVLEGSAVPPSVGVVSLVAPPLAVEPGLNSGGKPLLKSVE